MLKINVQNNKGYILVDDVHEERLKDARIYKQTRKDGKVSYAVKTPEMKKGSTMGLTKFLFNRNFRQIKPGNDYRATNLKNLSSKYFCVYRNSTMGDYRFEFTHNNKQYREGGFRRETDAAIAHDRLVQKLKLNRKLIILPSKDEYNAQVEQNKNNETTHTIEKTTTQSTNQNIVANGVINAFRHNTISAISNLGELSLNKVEQSNLFMIANEILTLSRILNYINSKQFALIEEEVNKLNININESKILKLNFETYVKGCI